jgi:hypothetical protein
MEEMIKEIKIHFKLIRKAIKMEKKKWEKERE